MAEVGFYHLTRTTAEEALPRLLGRTIDAGKRAVVWCRDERRVGEVDTALWAAPEPIWLPHGTAKLGFARHQPVWIEAAPAGGDITAAAGDALAPPNGASFLFLLDGVEAAALDRFERVFDLFDGSDEAMVTAARGRWSRLKAAGHGLAYWRQEASGWKKAG